MAYDAESNRIVLFGGYHLGWLADTWVYDVGSNAWQNKSPPARPPARAGFAMTYDPKSDRVIAFGGESDKGYALNDTWAYNLNADTWTELTPVVSPPPRVAHRLTYDAGLDRTILFGGHSRGSVEVLYNDTWAYDFNSNAWAQMTPVVSPPPRALHMMAYDEESDRIVIFGGASGPQGLPSGDTWAFDAADNTWKQMTPPGSPAPRGFDAGVYDAKADRILMFGGDSSGQNELWSYNLNANTWSKVNTAAKPSDRVIHAMAYDAASDRTVLFGGMWPAGPVTEPTLVKNRETWVFDRAASAWTMALGPLPPVAAFAFSPASPRVSDPIAFDGSPSTDADGSVVTYLWAFGDGSTGYGATVSHAFSGADTYAVRLTVTDDDGLTNLSARQVVVGPALDEVKPALAVVSPSDDAMLNSATATITGTASDDVAVQKVEVSLDNVTWIVAAGTTSWSATLTLAEGTNTIYVRVTDTAGNTATSTIHVTVAIPGGTTPSWPAWVWPLLAVGIAGGAAAVYLVMRRRRKRG